MFHKTGLWPRITSSSGNLSKGLDRPLNEDRLQERIWGIAES